MFLLFLIYVFFIINFAVGWCIFVVFLLVDTYPSEAVRAELSVQLGLSDRQLQMWFCHRRLKDRKAPSVKRPCKESPSLAGMSGGGEMGVVAEVGNEHGSGSSPFVLGVDPRRAVGRPTGVAVPRISADVKTMNRYYKPQQSIAELRAIAFVEAQLGEPLREDGPILGMEFDPLPPDAFGAPIGTVGFEFCCLHSAPFYSMITC